MSNVLIRNKKIINPFKIPKAKCFLNKDNKIRIYAYNETEDKDNLIWLYYGTKQTRPNTETRCRYVLGAFKKFPPQGNVLICFGLNPSTGVPADPEPTVKKLSKIAFSRKDKHGKDKYDGWVMLNLFPLRNSNSKSNKENTHDAFIDQLQEMDGHEYKRFYRKNVNYIEEILGLFSKEKVDILLAWGNSVENDKTGGLKRCIVGVDKIITKVYDKEWIKLHIRLCYNKESGRKRTQNGHPRHLNTDRLRREYQISPENAVLEPFEDYEDYINSIKNKIKKVIKT